MKPCNLKVGQWWVSTSGPNKGDHFIVTEVMEEGFYCTWWSRDHNFYYDSFLTLPRDWASEYELDEVSTRKAILEKYETE